MWCTGDQAVGAAAALAAAGLVSTLACSATVGVGAEEELGEPGGLDNDRWPQPVDGGAGDAREEVVPVGRLARPRPHG